MEKERLLTRNFVLGTFACFFLTMVFFVYFTGMSMYCTGALGQSSLVAGIITGTFVAGDVVARIVFATKVAVAGPKKAAVAALLVGAGLTLPYFLTDDVDLIFVVALFHGITYGVAETSIFTMVISGLPEARRGEGIGYFMLSNSLASCIGPFVSITLQSTGAFTMMFVFGTLSTVAALALMASSVPIPGVPAESKGFRMSDHFERSALKVSLIVFIMFFSYSGVLAFVAPYGESIGLGWYASIFFIMVSITTTFCRMFLGKVYDRHGENRALIPPILLFIAGMFMVATVLNGPELLVAGLMIGFMVAMLNTVAQALVVRDIPKERYSVAISTLCIFWDLAFAVGPLAHGALVDSLGYSENFLIMGCVAVAGFVLYLVLVGVPGARRRRSEERVNE